MQTFLPYADFSRSLQCLDKRRLGKQRVEAFQILKAIQTPTYGWQNHPAVNMWRGFELALAEYYNESLRAFTNAGGKNIVLQPIYIHGSYTYPLWLGNELVHSTHRANLLRKDPVFYGQYGWTEQPLEGYHWPV